MATVNYAVAFLTDSLNSNSLYNALGVDPTQGAKVPLSIAEPRTRFTRVASWAATRPCGLEIADVISGDGIGASTSSAGGAGVAFQATTDDSFFSAKDFLDLCKLPAATGVPVVRTVGDVLPLLRASILGGSASSASFIRGYARNRRMSSLLTDHSNTHQPRPSSSSRPATPWRPL